MGKFKIGDMVSWAGYEGYGTGEVINLTPAGTAEIRFENFSDYNDSEFTDSHTPPEKDLTLVSRSTPDTINPDHYSGDLVMRVIEERSLDFALGNAVKYLCRAGSKPGSSRKQDLLKAQWYLNRAIEREEAAE